MRCVVEQPGFGWVTRRLLHNVLKGGAGKVGSLNELVRVVHPPFLAGLGMFLFGMFMMEESIKLLSGRAFKVMIRRYTGSRLRGFATGMVSTSILQSSSAVSLMVLAFMGAGLMSLVNAIAVIIGAKVGTTVTILLGAIGGVPAKKRAAIGSLAFSAGTAAVVLPALLTKYILNITPEVPEAAIEALRKEVLQQLHVSVHYIGSRYRIDVMQSRSAGWHLSDRWVGETLTRYIGCPDLEQMHAEIFAFYAKVQAYN